MIKFTVLLLYNAKFVYKNFFKLSMKIRQFIKLYKIV